jgi:NAD(P)-dependent dehydrogenase (short-subunit alcohol dehydrogenase family)
MPRNQLAVVTGASSGIGQATAGTLAARGFHVLAGVRRQVDADQLAGDSVEPVILDITDPSQVAAIAERVEREAGTRPLGVLVNNAGIAVNAPVETIPMEEWRRQFEVNFFGQVAITQALLPALLAGGGRVVNVSSIGGRVALPMVAAYNASKFALEAVSDSLRRELHGQGVDVILIEPGGVKTPIWKKGNELADEIQEQMPPEVERLYGNMIEAVRRETVRIEQKTGIEPRAVAEVIGRALTAKRPRTRYLVGTDAKIRGPVAKFMPDRLMDRAIARQLGG